MAIHFWKTEEDIKAAIQGMYTHLREVDEELFLLGESRAETTGLNAAGSAGGYDIYFNNTLTSATVGAEWKTFYSLINSCNLIIKYAEGVNFNSQADKNLLFGTSLCDESLGLLCNGPLLGRLDYPYRTG
mgnify:CR=1 FL=1